MHKLSIILLLFLFGFTGWVLTEHSGQSGIFYGDALGYHSYLPATLIYQNLEHIQDLALDTSIDNGIREGIERWKYAYPSNENGNVIIQYTMGISLMNTPAFLMSHLFALITEHPANGFSIPYVIGIKVITVLYVLLGFLLLYKVLVQLYDPRMVLNVLLVMVLGTNLYWFTFVQTGMAHSHIFFLISGIIYCTHAYYASNKVVWIVFGGALIGLLTLIRPTDIIIILIPMLYGIYDFQYLKGRVHNLKNNISIKAVVFTTAFIIPIIPQLLYWKKMTGQWIFYSYKGQTFDWSHPHIIEGLLGGNNGWLTYTPLMILPLVSLLFTNKYNPLRLASWIILPLYIYIVYAWWCYWYINGFGSRPMIHLYPILAFALLSMLRQIGHRWQVYIWTVILVLSIVNLVFTFKQLEGQLYTDSSNHTYIFSTLLKKDISIDDLTLLDTEVHQVECSDSKILSSISLSDSVYVKYFVDSMDAILLDRDMEYAPFSIDYMLKKNDLENANYLKLQGNFLVKDLVFPLYDHTLMVFEVYRKGVSIDWKGVKLQNKIAQHSGPGTRIHQSTLNKWGMVKFTYPTTKLRQGDQIKGMIWNPRGNRVYTRSFSLSLCQE